MKVAFSGADFKDNPVVKRSTIAIMLPRFSRYGGVEQFGFRLAECLARRGHAVDFICARKEEEAPQGVRIINVGRPPGCRWLKMLWFLVRAEQCRRRGNYDLSISLGKTWNQDVSRMGGGPLKVFWEKSEQALPVGLPRTMKRLKRRFSPANWLTILVEKHQFNEKSDVIAVSHLVRDWLLETHHTLDPSRVSVVYNRPDQKRYFPPGAEERASARKALALKVASSFMASEEPIFIGTASTNFQLKGIEPLIRAMALLPPHTVLFIAGGRDHGVYSRLARSIGVADRVVFCGKVDDMPSFYRALDIFILPTFYDACSNAVLEALASGCKVLTSNSNGASFFLDKDAVFPDPGNVAELAARLRTVMEKPAPPAFIWPEDTPSGLAAFTEFIEKRLEAKEAFSKNCS